MATRARVSPVALAAWTAFLRAHSGVTRELERQLAATHALTLSDYDVLVQLGGAPEGSLRPAELARAVLLTRSGVTRLVSGLDAAGLVERVACPSDGRGQLVRLTEAGAELLRGASRTHLDGVRRLFADRFDESELELLSGLLGRLSEPAAGSEAVAA